MRNQLKNVKIQNAETIQSYFTRVSHIKDQREAIEENVEQGEIVVTTFNGIPRSWDSFIQGICARNKLIKFNILQEECTQEEARLVSREENMAAFDHQALITEEKNNEGKREDHSTKYPRNYKRIKYQEWTT